MVVATVAFPLTTTAAPTLRASRTVSVPRPVLALEDSFTCDPGFVGLSEAVLERLEPTPELAFETNFGTFDFVEEACDCARSMDPGMDVDEEVLIPRSGAADVTLRVVAGRHGDFPGGDGGSLILFEGRANVIMFACGGHGSNGDFGFDGGYGGEILVTHAGDDGILVSLGGHGGKGGDAHSFGLDGGDGGSAGSVFAQVLGTSQALGRAGNGGDAGAGSGTGEPGVALPGGECRQSSGSCDPLDIFSAGGHGGRGAQGAAGLAPGDEGGLGGDGGDGGGATARCGFTGGGCFAMAIAGNGGEAGQGGDGGGSGMAIGAGGLGGLGGAGGAAEAFACCSENALAYGGDGAVGGKGGLGCHPAYHANGGAGGAAGPASAEIHYGAGGQSVAYSRGGDAGDGGVGGDTPPGTLCHVGQGGGPGDPELLTESFNFCGGIEKTIRGRKGRAGRPGARGL